jgi:hypothetical protein
MIIPEQIETTLKQLSATPYGFALIELLNQWENEMNDVSTILTVEQLEGRKIALKLVKDLFKFMGDRKVEKINKNQYI